MPRKVLIVDDNAINRQLLKKTLSGEYDIIEASDGREALKLMRRQYKALSAVLLDIIMPEMDGYEVLQAVQDNGLLAQIPIIMVTGSEDEASRVRALSLGANDFITKPFNPEIVCHCLRNNITLRETASILNAIQRDKLTGLYNRETFFEKVTEWISEREPGWYILSCFDIDNFKLINDQFGAAEGDRILKLLGRAIQEEMDGADGIGSRISADNFAVLYPAANQNLNLADCLRSRNLVLLEQQNVAFSVGRYVVSDLSLSASAIYDRAYIAKQSVKGRYDKHLAYFDKAMLEKLVRSQQITSEMEPALAGRQFEVWFQPQYNHAAGTLVGAEALARWRHPQKGILPPADFIPLFEQTGFIYELDQYVWREVCRLLRKWLDAGDDPLPVSVNVSRYDIFRADLIDVITGITREYDIPARLLRLEITESAFSISTDLIVKIVRQLIDHGFTIEIDDFGSGYSSLNTLKNVPAQVVKLDMRFLENDSGSARGGNILESVVRMTKWLGMTVLAEGVEDRSQADFLKSIGCSYVQGYLYAKPMPAADYEALFQAAETRRHHFALDKMESLAGDTFWDPQSVDSLVFNSFAGSACVYEYYRGDIEMIRVSDRYAAMVFGPNLTVDELLRIQWRKHASPQTEEAIRAAMERSIQLQAEVTGEYLFLDLPGCDHEVWLRSSLRVIAAAGERFLIYCVSENITGHQQALERLRVSEEENRLAIAHSRNVVCRYNVATHRLTISPGIDPKFGVSGVLEDVPESQVQAGQVSADTAENYRAFYNSICQGEKTGSLLYQRLSNIGWRWVEARFSTIFDQNGTPVSAVISFADVTESLEKEAVYKQWKQTIQVKAPGSYSLFRCNVSRKTVLSPGEGALLPADFRLRSEHLDEQTSSYVQQSVWPEDRNRFWAFMSADALLAGFHQGRRVRTLEYREQRPDGAERWLRLTVNLMESPYSTDVEAFLLFEDIDEAKRTELYTLERAESDPLTGVLNRTAFTEKVNERIRTAEPGALHALMMLDMDGFKLVNDVFGHAAGDQALIDIAGQLRSTTRRGDLVGRLGGDEFVVFLSDIDTQESIAAKAERICALVRRSFSQDVQLSGSLGVALCPRDGTDFETLYRKADATLYYVKDTGRNHYAFYRQELEALQHRPARADTAVGTVRQKIRRHMLIVEDNRLDYELLANIFRDDFTVERAGDGAAALIRLRHYGSAVSVVLLDLMMPGLDGFAVLDQMRQSTELFSIPVIVVSADNGRETCLRTIRAGAADFVVKPVDPDLLRLRVQSAISKAENERLRARNSVLELQNGETAAYRTVLDRLGLAVAVNDWGKGTFLYSPAMGQMLTGQFDGRTLWRILLSDLTGDAKTVRTLQQLVHDVADDRSRTQDAIAVQLKTPGGGRHWFQVQIYKLANEYGLTDKLVLTFQDTGSARPPVEEGGDWNAPRQ